MKNTLIALAVLAFATSAQATEGFTAVQGSYSATNSVQSFSGAMAATSGNGTSVSHANNTQFATTVGSASGTQNLALQTAEATANGFGQTGSTSFASNVSTGSGSGAAGANGTSLVNGGSSVSIDGPQSVMVTGSFGSVAETGVETGTNGTAFATGLNTVNFNGSATASQFVNADLSLTNAVNTTANADSVTNESSVLTGSGALTFANNVAGSAVVNAVAKSGDAFTAE